MWQGGSVEVLLHISQTEQDNLFSEANFPHRQGFPRTTAASRKLTVFDGNFSKVDCKEYLLSTEQKPWNIPYFIFYRVDYCY